MDVANVTASADGVYKAVQDGLITESGNQFAAFGGKAPTYSTSAIDGNKIFLNDADNKVRRKATTDVNATIEAEVIPSATALDNANGEIRFKIGANTTLLRDALWNALAADYNTDDTMGKAAQSGGGGGGGATPEGYSRCCS